ncbi:hypothetical protein Tco_0992771 [Tanacetum coccineum]|uniref:Uncharacterized protein n=1 Tax=Tanacetum coccineum TaxID=301880 RepID=A0ABQ5F4S6_9ASTR
MHNLKIDNLTQDILIGPAFNLLKGTCKSFVELVVPADYFFNNDLEYLKGGISSRKYTTSTTKTKATRYDNIEGIKDMVLELWSPVKVEDLQLGVESYQKKLNITKPETFRSGIFKLTPYTSYKNLQGIIYQDTFKRNRLMRFDELYKFCDERLKADNTLKKDVQFVTVNTKEYHSDVLAIITRIMFTANHDVCVLNYVNDMNSYVDNQSANVLKCENQKKHKANVKKSKELGSKGSPASSRPSKPRTCLRWVPTRRIFAMCGKLIAIRKHRNKAKKSMCDNASTSNPSEASNKGFSNSASLLDRLARLRKQHTSLYPIVVL